MEREGRFLVCNTEAELASVMNLVYLQARDYYRMEREDKDGVGLASAYPCGL